MAQSLRGLFGDAARQAGDAFGQALKGNGREGNPPAPQIHIDMNGGRGVELVPMTCPKCGASIQAPSSQSSCFCTYCGAQLLVDDGSTTVTYRTVDEARIRELDAKSALELRQLELEEQRRPGRIKATIVLAVIGAVMLIGGNFLAKGSGDGNSAWYMVSLLGYLPLSAIAFIWLIGKNPGNQD